MLLGSLEGSLHVGFKEVATLGVQAEWLEGSRTFCAVECMQHRPTGVTPNFGWLVTLRTRFILQFSFDTSQQSGCCFLKRNSNKSTFLYIK